MKIACPNAKAIEFEFEFVSNTCGIMQRMFTIFYYISHFSPAAFHRILRRLETFLIFFSFCRTLVIGLRLRRMIKFSSHVLEDAKIFPPCKFLQIFE